MTIGATAAPPRALSPTPSSARRSGPGGEAGTVRRLLFLLSAAAAFAPSPLWPQVQPSANSGDPRIQVIDYAPDQVIRLQGAPGYQTTIELSPDEQVENIAIGDSSAWQASSNRRGDHVFLKEIRFGVSTNMTVVTNARLYNFQLVGDSGFGGDVPYTVRFRYPAASTRSATEGASTDAGGASYRLAGDKALRPSEINDDGTHTYIRWPRERSLPAVYALTDAGKEMLVNGMMREDVLVIDSVANRLVFRIDKNVASATRTRNGR
jgi:type IV secretion system protein VirB9